MKRARLHDLLLANQRAPLRREVSGLFINNFQGNEMKYSRSLLALGTIFVAASAMALPPAWDPFMVCTKEYAPHSAPSGHMQTTVAERVTTVCYSLAPPTLPNSGEFGPIGPSPDPRDPADVPCNKVSDAIKTAATHKRGLDAQIRALDTAIAAGHDALNVVQNAGLSLATQCAVDRRACQAQQTVYMAALQKKIAEIGGTCNHVPLADRADCRDSIADEAEVSPAVSAARAKRDAKCDLLQASTGACMRSFESGEVANRLGAELQSWAQQRKDLFVESVKASNKIKALRAKQNSPECKAP